MNPNTNKQQAHDMILIFRTQCEMSNLSDGKVDIVQVTKESVVGWCNKLLEIVDGLSDQYYNPNATRNG